MHVAVIGAGPSGLVTMKELLEEGHTATCFEKAPTLGGVFLYNKRGGGVHESTRLTSSVFITCFSDFAPPAHAPPHFPHTEYLQYLRDYATHFRLLPFIKFAHLVERVDALPGGRWRVSVQDASTQRTTEQVFDAVAICSGTHQHPSIPDLPGRETFRGTILHSNTYKRAAPFQGKSVLVVGAGESATDIVEEVSAVAKRCVLSLRRGVLVIPRLLFNEPNDYYTGRLFYSVPDWLFRTRHPAGLHIPSLVLLVLTFPLFIAPVVLLHAALESFTAESIWLRLLAIISLLAFLVWLLAQVVTFLTREVTPKEAGIMARLMSRSGGGEGEQFATKSLGAVRAIARGRCTLKPAIEQLTGSGAVFADGTSCEADVIIFCTGFTTSFPFLGRHRFDARTLYKNCFDPDLGPTLCFIGFARPGIGAIPPMSEMQARWFARVLSAHCQLPAGDAMRAQIQKDRDSHQRTFRVVSDRVTGLVDYPSYMDQLADFIDCKPRWRELVTTPGLLFRVYCHPFAGYQFRLRGPHSKREEAIATLKRLPVKPIRLLQNYALLTVVVTAELLYRMGFRLFKPNVRL